MSKIEDALNKAKSERRFSNSGSEASKQLSVNKATIEPKETLLNDKEVRIVDRVSSVKEIALMNEGEVLENQQLSELKIIYSDMPEHKYANVYRGLRTELLQNKPDGNFIVMVTSCVHGEDSGSVALNLSTAFTFDKSKTSLLIDCDINNPKIDSALNLQSEYGLTDYLESDDVCIESIIHKTGIKRLRMIPAGSSRETPTEYFTSMRMRELLGELYQRYTDRYVFIHSAPVLESADTKILVDLCDYVVLVVPYGQATRSRVKAAVDAIGEKKLLGVVFNGIPSVPGTSKRSNNK